MKFNCSRDDLVQALSLVRRGNANRSTMNVLGGILFNIFDQKLHLTGTDLKIAIKTEIPAEAEKDGAVILDGALISSIVNKLPSGPVYFESDDNNRVHVHSGLSRFNLNGMPAEDYPDFPKPDQTGKFTISNKDLKKLIDGTRFAVAQKDNLPVITGIKIEYKDGSVRFIACDGFRLAIKNKGLGEQTGSKDFILPGRAINELSSMLSSFPGDVDIMVSPAQAYFDFGEGSAFTTRLIDGQYVDYENIFPDQAQTSFVVNKNELLEICEQAQLLSTQTENNLFKFTIDSGKLEVTSKSEIGDYTSSIDIENQGDDLTIAFNTKYFIDALHAIPDEEIKLEMTNPIAPVEITPLEGDDFVYLILPVRLQSTDF